MQPLSIIKLGGGLVAPKDWQPEQLNVPVLQSLCREIAKIWQTQSVGLVIVVGSGNFGHSAVQKYGITTPFGITKVQQIARKTGEAVVRELLANGLPASLIAPHDIWYDGTVDSIIATLQNRLIPVLYGDVVQDRIKPAVIFSGETCISMLIPPLLASNYTIKKIIQAGSEAGVYDTKQKVIPEINKKNWHSYKSGITAAAPIDVTGGMLHKVELSLDIATRHRIDTYIIDGSIQDRLYKCAVDKPVPGTHILAA